MKHTILQTLLLCLCLETYSQQMPLKVIKTFHIASAGGWDYIAVNKGKIYVSHSTQVNILEEDSGDSIGYIPNTTGVHGIAFDNENGRGYTSNGRLNNVKVFDLKNNDSITCFPTGKNPDAILFEPFTKTIITCNGGSNDLTVIDPVKRTIKTTIAVGGKPEEAVADGNGKLFVNIEDKNEIVVIDLNYYKVMHHWKLSPGEGPTGLAYDKNTNRIFAGCEKLLVVLDASTGKIVDKIIIGDGCDGVAFNANNNTIYTSNGEGTITAIMEEDANTYKILGNYPTKRGARTITIDEKTQNLYLPTADFEPLTDPNTRPKMIPGTFQVLVVH